MKGYGGLCNIRSPSDDDAVITNAIITVLSSRPSSSSPVYQRQQVQAPQHQVSGGTRAFVSYDSALVPRMETRPTSNGQSKMKLVFDFLRRDYLTRREAQMQENHPTRHQLHHILSERMRRKKIKEGFEDLRSLLPLQCKKDQVSVLFNTMEYLSAMNARVLELEERNQLAGMRLLPAKETRREANNLNERVAVHVISSDESMYEDGEIALRVTVSENDCGMMDLMFHLLECLKQMKEMSLVSMETDTQLHQMNQFNRAFFRLRIKTSDWDEQSFKEAMIRAVDDVTRRQMFNSGPFHQGGPT